MTIVFNNYTCVWKVNTIKSGRSVEVIKVRKGRKSVVVTKLLHRKKLLSKLSRGVEELESKSESKS